MDKIDLLAEELKVAPKELRKYCQDLGCEMVWHKFYDPKSRVVVLTKERGKEKVFHEFEIDLKGSLDGSIEA
jgi:hypothetical protein